MIRIGPYLLDTEDKDLALEAATELNRMAEKKSLPHRGYVIVRSTRIQYELYEVPVQVRTL